MIDTKSSIHGLGADDAIAPATTLDFLEYRASSTPGRIALASRSRNVTCLDFYQDSLRFALALKGLGVIKGSLVLVVVPSDTYLHWLLLLACEANGATSVSWPDTKSLQHIKFLDEVDFVLAEDATQIELVNGRQVHVSDEWRGQIFGMKGDFSQPFHRDRAAAADVLRITHSSGTTGGQKAMLLSRHAQEAKLKFLAENLLLSSDDALLLTMPFSVNATYLCATHYLRRGVLVVSGPLLWGLKRFQVTYLEILPIALSDLLNRLPPNFVKPRHLSIRVIGASFNLDLKNKALNMLCAEISGRYAANEAWPIAYEVDHAGIGTLLPAVQVRILDESGRATLDGGVGQIAVRCPTMIGGYYKDDEASMRHFVDGFFLTGDLGRILPSRKLQVIARCDDVLNRGGLKIAPDDTEARFKSIPGVVDLAVTTSPSDQLFDDLCFGVVRANGFERKDIIQQIIGGAASLGWLKVRIKFMDSLPKTANGKLSRQLLRQQFVA